LSHEAEKLIFLIYFARTPVFSPDSCPSLRDFCSRSRPSGALARSFELWREGGGLAAPKSQGFNQQHVAGCLHRRAELRVHLFVLQHGPKADPSPAGETNHYFSIVVG
jgi:hypothetical protein